MNASFPRTPTRSGAAFCLALASFACSVDKPSPDERAHQPTVTRAGAEAAAPTTVVTLPPTAAEPALAEPTAAKAALNSGGPATTQKAKIGSASIKRLVIAGDVKGREPIDVGVTTAQKPVVAFLEFENPTNHELDVQVVFQHESGQRVGFIELSVPAEQSRYRTWGRTHNIRQPGHWTAIVTSDAGEELGRETFTVDALNEEGGC